MTFFYHDIINYFLVFSNVSSYVFFKKALSYGSMNEAYDQLVDLFLEWNQKINLSAIRDEAGVRERHIVDSLLATEFVDFEDKRVLDIGAGGGFPTLPLAIECPTAQITALDSVGKKMKVVQSMADTIGLENSRVY